MDRDARISCTIAGAAPELVLVEFGKCLFKPHRLSLVVPTASALILQLCDSKGALRSSSYRGEFDHGTFDEIIGISPDRLRPQKCSEILPQTACTRALRSQWR